MNFTTTTHVHEPRRAATFLARSVLGALLAAVTTSTGHAQDVCLSEIQADPGNSWIEVLNRSSHSVDLSQWSLHVASHSPYLPGNYWWPFPIGTTLAPGAMLRVHWYEAATATPGPGEYYTGTSPYGFLFGLGGEPLAGTAGAAALFRSQSNLQMNSAAILEDWVSWGSGGYQREALAISAGLWQAGRVAPSFAAGTSLARDIAAIGTTTYADQTWFVDQTPTPGAANVAGAELENYGNACTLPGHHLLGLPSLTANSLPLAGNSAFALEIGNTTGLYGEFVLVGYGTAAAPTGLPSILPNWSGAACHESIDPRTLVATTLLPTELFTTVVPLPLSGAPAIAGLEVHAQALVLELMPNANPPYQGLSDALRIVVGQ